MHTAHRLLLALGFAALSASSFAATTVYTSSSTFLAATAAGAYTNTFSGLASVPPSSYAGNGFSYTIAAPSGLYSSGTLVGTNFPNEALTITFTGSTVTALGGNFYATDIGDAFQSTALTLTLSDGTSVSFTPTSTTDSYRGFVSTVGITTLTIGAPANPAFYGNLDNFTVGVSAVPEPATVLLSALGIGGLLVATRRKA